MLWAGALSLFAIAVFYLLISAMIQGLLLRSPFWTNALYAIALVSLTMQDTAGKFDDIAAVYCVYMWKRHWKVWFSLVLFLMTCYTFLCKGLIHQALSLYAIEVPFDVSIVSIRYCSADVDIRPYMKGMYLMRGIAAKWEKATRSCLWFSFSFVQNDVQCSTIHWSVPPSKHFLYTLLGCFTYLHWLYPLLQCWCWHRTIHQGYLYLMFGTAFFTHSLIILGLLLRSPFWTNALYAIALVSLTMQDTPGKFDDIAAVYCVCVGKRHRNVLFSLIILHDDLSNFPMQRADPPITVSIRYWSAFRCQHCLYPLLQCWCWYQTIHEANVLDERYSSQMGKGNKKLSVIFIFFCSEWRTMLDHSLVCSTKQALSLYAIGVLYLSALALSVIAMLMLISDHTWKECSWWEV